MTNEIDPGRKLVWERWAADISDSDRAAVELGKLALQTIVAINAGALVALLAFVGQVWAKASSAPQVFAAVIDTMCFFAAGLVAGAAAIGASYLYQSLQTAKLSAALPVSPNDPWDKPPSMIAAGRLAFAALMIVLALIAYGAFLWGALAAAAAFRGLAGTA